MRLEAQSATLVPKIKEFLDKGMSYGDIEKVLQAQGYVNRKQEPVKRQDISYFMLTNGVRLRHVNQPPRGSYKAKEVEAPTEPVARTWLQDIEDIITSNLNPALKERVIKLLGR